MYQNNWVKRPLDAVVSIAVALVVLGIAFSIVRWAWGGFPAPFDGSVMAGVLSALGIFLMVMFGLAVAGAVIWVLFAAGATATGSPWGTPKDWASMGAVSELKKRYARGLVSREEYLRVLADLEAPPKANEPAPPPPAPTP